MASVSRTTQKPQNTQSQKLVCGFSEFRVDPSSYAAAVFRDANWPAYSFTAASSAPLS